MPRIRIRTADGERIVGTPNCSTLTIRVDAYTQRSTLQIRADAQLLGGGSVIEHWSWDFAELPDQSTIELVSEPQTGPAVRYDPPDASLSPEIPILAEPDDTFLAEIRAAEKELEDIAAKLRGIGGASVDRPAQDPDSQRGNAQTLYCSFCGKSHEEVRKLVAEPSVFICDVCVQIASDIMAE